MAKEKVTLTLDTGNLAALRSLVGSRSLSSSVDAAIAAYVARLKHLAAVEEWLAELDSKHGPVPNETLEWAARIVNDWSARSAGRQRRRKAG
jgi:predicted transcriptional regulator